MDKSRGSFPHDIYNDILAITNFEDNYIAYISENLTIIHQTTSCADLLKDGAFSNLHDILSAESCQILLDVYEKRFTTQFIDTIDDIAYLIKASYCKDGILIMFIQHNLEEHKDGIKTYLNYSIKNIINNMLPKIERIEKSAKPLPNQEILPDILKVKEYSYSILRELIHYNLLTVGYSGYSCGFEETNLLDIVNEVSEKSINIIGESNILFKIICDKDIRITIDRDQIRFMLYNFISNSVQYCDEYPVSVSIRCYKKSNRVYMSYTDDGPGIKMENIRQALEGCVTDKFDPVNSILNRGTSIPILFKIARNHKGSLMHADSDNKSPTGFLMSFPVSLIEEDIKVNQYISSFKEYSYDMSLIELSTAKIKIDQI